MKRFQTLVPALGFLALVLAVDPLEATPLSEVEIDIRPGPTQNRINPFSRGVIAVAILGSESLDVSNVDVTTLAFGPAGAPVALRNDPRLRDTNRDGFDDLVAHFLTEESGIAPGDEEACLTGETLDGRPFGDCDSIMTVPPN
jgi:hypothetical protein